MIRLTWGNWYPLIKWQFLFWWLLEFKVASDVKLEVLHFMKTAMKLCKRISSYTENILPLFVFSEKSVILPNSNCFIAHFPKLMKTLIDGHVIISILRLTGFDISDQCRSLQITDAGSQSFDRSKSRRHFSQCYLRWLYEDGYPWLSG